LDPWDLKQSVNLSKRDDPYSEMLLTLDSEINEVIPDESNNETEDEMKTTIVETQE
jgi:hypothetical protein